MIIGISGYIGSGKDEVGKIIKSIDSSFQIKKFASKLKTIASILTGIEEHKFEDQEFKKTYLGEEWNTHYYSGDKRTEHRMQVRTFLQRLGTEAIREGLHTNTWVNALFSDYIDEYNPVQGNIQSNWIITDTRFPNEAQAIKDRGGVVIRVNRGKQEMNYITKAGLHFSETALDDWEFNYVIENNGNIEKLIEEVNKMLKHFNL